MNDITKNAGSDNSKISRNMTDFMFSQLDNKVYIKLDDELVSIVIDIPKTKSLESTLSLIKVMITCGEVLPMISICELIKLYKDNELAVFSKTETTVINTQIQTENTRATIFFGTESESTDCLIIDINGQAIMNLSGCDRKIKKDFNDLNLLPTSYKQQSKNTA